MDANESVFPKKYLRVIARAILTIPEAAIYMGIAEFKVKKLVDTGKLPILAEANGTGTKMRIRIAKKAIDEYIERNQKYHKIK